MAADPAWQRCRTHCMAPYPSRWPWAPCIACPSAGVATLIRTAYIQLSPEDLQARANAMVAQLREHFPTSAPMRGFPVASCE